MCSKRKIEISSLSRIAHSKDDPKKGHPNSRNDEAEKSLPADHLDRNNSMFCHDELFQDKLSSSEELRKGNEEYAHDNTEDIRRFPGLGGTGRWSMIVKSSGKTLKSVRHMQRTYRQVKRQGRQGTDRTSKEFPVAVVLVGVEMDRRSKIPRPDL